MDGYPLHACFAGMIPAFVSWIFAAWTTTASRFPNVSTTMCRFLPLVFFAVYPAFLCRTGGLDALGINDRIAWLRFAPGSLSGCFDRIPQDLLPQPAQTSAPVEAVYGPIGWKIVRQVPPLTPCFHEVQHCVCPFPHCQRPSLAADGVFFLRLKAKNIAFSWLFLENTLTGRYFSTACPLDRSAVNYYNL